MKSALKENAFYKKAKVKKGTIDPMTGFEIKEMYLGTEKLYELMEKLLSLRVKEKPSKNTMETICPKCGNHRDKVIGEELKCLKCSYFPLQVIKEKP